GIENAGAADEIGSQRAAELNGAGAAFFEWSIVEKRVRIGVDDFMRKGRCSGVVDRDGPDLAIADGFDDAGKTIEIHRFVQAIVDGFADQGMVWNAWLSGEIFGAGHLIGEDGGEKVVRAHALNG